MSSQPKTYLTPEEYLRIERAAETKSEYFNGEMFAMSGASRKHNLVTGNISRRIGNQLDGRPCEIYASDMRVHIPATGLYTYPDVVVVCGEPMLEDKEFDTLLNPTLLIEVLSKSTASYDRGDKFMHYRSIDSLSEYLLVAQNECRVEHHTKQADGRWILEETRALDATINLASINCQLVLKEVYARVL